MTERWFLTKNNLQIRNDWLATYLTVTGDGETSSGADLVGQGVSWTIVGLGIQTEVAVEMAIQEDLQCLLFHRHDWRISGKGGARFCYSIP